ncbi:L-aspartate oxidase [Helicobacter pametensis]|uniref:L-aspartate oxidase n=1 Tax=Helicobacter pametensis TaxID=95149 RepID=UPI000484DD19|nr:FAD-dependent oxidoreductase [Helicobacter pametensis]
MNYDVLIVGSGVAGLYCAQHLPSSLKVLLLCKENPQECNTHYAQGGISVALDANDVKDHIMDSLDAGSHLNNVQALEILSQESLSLVSDLDALGIFVDRDPQGNVLFTQEGGHQKPRIVHFDGDGSGRFLHTQLLERLQHELWSDAQVIDLIFDHDRCVGALIQHGTEIIQVRANYIVLASGGIGGLYTYHTNARTLSADLHGIILKHGLRLKDMEMMQFHPTVYTQAPSARKPLLSEAIRGEGGKIVNEKGERFLFAYDSRGELAPRDIVARGIFDYMSQSGQSAFLDLSSFTQIQFEQRFPNIYSMLKQYGINPPSEKIPISPAFHYCMGGIEVGLDSKVVGIDNLYAIGECANNGVHGANRLASNSLLEGLVFGKRVAQEIREREMDQRSYSRAFPSYKQSNLYGETDLILKNNLRDLMWNQVGIIRTKKGLQEALKQVEMMRLQKMGDLFALRLAVAQEIITQALKREKSLGAHFLQD